MFQVKSNYTVCCYSKCGKYIAAGAEYGEISIWDIDNSSVIREAKVDDLDKQCISAIDWNPTNNGEFAYTDNTGQFGLVENIFDVDENIIGHHEVEGVDEIDDFGGSKYF